MYLPKIVFNEFEHAMKLGTELLKFIRIGFFRIIIDS